MTIPPIAAETLFRVGSLPVTNSLVAAWIAVLLFVVAAWALKRSLSEEKPGRFQTAVEGMLEFMLGYADQVTGDRRKSKRFLPIVGTLFLFILVCNWMGSIPGYGSITGGAEHVPLLRQANADLNLTLAMALLAVVVSHLFGLITVGFFAHWNRFIALGKVWHGFKLGGINIMVGLVELMVGVIELFAEIAKVISLSLRLFGNIFAGEVLITVIYSLITWLIPLPFTFLELIVGVIQATVFSMLALVYLTVLTEKPHGSAEEHREDELGEAHGEGHVHDPKSKHHHHRPHSRNEALSLQPQAVEAPNLQS